LESKEKALGEKPSGNYRSSTGAEVLELTEAPESLPLQLNRRKKMLPNNCAWCG
jgi:hypothetical protein